MRAIASRITLGLVILLLAACSAGPEYKRVQITAPGQTPPATTEQGQRAPLRVAISGVISPKETYKTYQDLLQYMSKRLDRPVELVQRKTYAEVNDLIRAGGIDLAFVCTQAYVQGQQDFGMELIGTPVVGGEPLYRAYIIVPADGPANSLEQLQGRIFAFTDPDSNSGRLYPTYALRLKGTSPESFFSKVVYTYSHDNSIKAVADKLVDGASVDSLVYEATIARNPELAARTRIVQRSEPFGAPPVVVHPSQSPALKAQLQETLLGLDSDPEGQVILRSLGIDRFVVPDQAVYEPVREMLRQLRGQR